MRAPGRAVVAFALFIAVAGCGDSPSQPQPLFAVTISAPTSIVGDTILTPFGNNCRWRTTASATLGQPGDHAVWTGIEWQARRASDGSLLETGEFTSSEVQAFWGSPRLDAGTTQTSAGWGATYPVVPWRLTMTFRFRFHPGGALGARSVTVECR